MGREILKAITIKSTHNNVLKILLVSRSLFFDDFFCLLRIIKLYAHICDDWKCVYSKAAAAKEPNHYFIENVYYMSWVCFYDHSTIFWLKNQLEREND